EPLDHRTLLVGQDFSLDLSDAETARYGLGGRLIVARQHDDPDAIRGQRFEGFRRRRLDGVANGDDAANLPITGDVDDGCSVLAQPLGFRIQSLRENTKVPQKSRIAERDLTAPNDAHGALSGWGVELRDVGERDAALTGSLDDRTRQRVLARALH